MKNLTDISLPSVDSLKSLHHRFQNTLLLPGLKPLQWERRQINSDLDYNSIVSSLNIPLPEDLDHAFDDLPLSSQVRVEISHKYLQALQQLQHLHRQKFEETCRSLHQLPQAKNAVPLPHLMEGIRKVYESTYTKRLHMLKNQVVSLVKAHTPPSGSKKVPFNVECTPLLMKYFESNAYPSAPDRQFLAQKTTMTPRQIEVWFQNHRKRAKENGQVVRRMVPNKQYNFSPSTEKSLPFLWAHQPVMNVLDEDDCSDGIEVDAAPTKRVDNLSVPVSSLTPHIFPARFSASTSIHHFHEDTTFTFPLAVWTRKPSSQPIPRSEIKMDDFIATFASKLKLRDGASTNKRKSAFRSQMQTPWYFATTTIASCAPHPAFIQAPRPSAFPAELISTSSSGTSLPLASPQPPSIISSPSLARQSRSLKKAAPFPKRYPSKYHPYAHVSASLHHGPSRLHSVESTTFGSRASSIRSMPSRANSAMVTESTSHPVSWVATLESTPPCASVTTLEYTPPAGSTTSSVYSTPSATNRITSMESTAYSASRIPSFDSNSSFGSRTSSLSSLESPLPSSPYLQPQTDDTLAFDHQDLQFLGELSDFDQLMTGNTPLSLSGDPFSPKADGTFGYSFPYLQNVLTSFPMNFIQTLS